MRSRYIRFYDVEFPETPLIVDTTGSDALFPASDPSVVQIRSQLTFEERHDYYVTLDRSIVVDAQTITGQCRPGSEPISNDTFWRFHVRE